MKRAITGIVAAGLALGMMAPAAFAATTSAPTLTASGAKTIALDGATLYAGVQAGTEIDNGQPTQYFPIYYLNQALTKAGYVNSYDAATKTWNIQMPGVDASKISVAGGVGTGDGSIAINGVVVKKVNVGYHKDFAGGPNAQVTTYMPIYYLGNVLAAAGFSNAWNGTSFGFQSNYGTDATLTLSAASTTVVANNTSGDVFTLNVVDANGHVVRDYSGNVTVSAPAHGVLKDMNGNALTVTNNVVTVPVKNGTAQFQLISSGTPVGSSDTVTATYTPSGATNTVSVSTTVNYVAQAASAVGIAVKAGSPTSLSVNSSNSSTVVHLSLNDQGGKAMTSGGAYVTLTLNGPASFSSSSSETTYTTWVGVGGSDVTVYGEQGVSGSVTVTASSNSLTGGSVTIPAVVNTAPSAVKLTSTTGTDTNGAAFTLYTAELVDSNGNIVDNSSDTVKISDDAANGGGAVSYFSGVSGLNNGVPVSGQGSATAPTLTFSHGVAQFAVETTTAGTGAVTVTATETANSFKTTSSYGYVVGTAYKVAPASGLVPSIEAGQSAQVSMQLEDVNGNAVAQAGQQVVFTLTQGGTSAAFPNGNTSTYTATTDANGVATVTLSVPSTSSTGTFSVTGTYDNHVSASSQVKVTPAADFVTSDAFSGAWTVTSETAGNPFTSVPTVNLKNAIGGTVNSTDKFQITSSNYSTIAFAAASGWTADASGSGAFDLTAGGSSFSLPTINAKMAGSATITIKDLSNPSVAALTEVLTSNVGQATTAPWVEYQGKAISSSNSLTVAANTPVQLTVVNVDAGGNPVPVSGTGQVVNLLDANGGTYRLTPNGATVSSVTIPAGQSSVTVYYVNGTAQTITGGLTTANATGVAASVTQSQAYAAATPVAATGSITFGTPVANDTVTVDGIAYTYVASSPATGQFTTPAQLVALINADTNVVAAVDSSNTSKVDVTAKTAGTAGNSIALATSDATQFTLSGATLSGGSAGTATPEIYTLAVSSGATYAGTVNVTFNDGTINTTIPVAVSATDTAAQVATKIYTALNANATLAGAYTFGNATAGAVTVQQKTASNTAVAISVQG